jgi:FkbM family methyltransferase
MEFIMSLSDTLLRISTDGRTLARKLGVLQVLSKCRTGLNMIRGRNQYEISFDEAMKNEIRKDDTVWDVGANVGIYTKIFSHAVSQKGKVCAFEPTPACYQELKQQCGQNDNIQFFNMALGDKEAIMQMNIADDLLGATHSLVNDTPSTNNVSVIQVRVSSGDYLIKNENLPCPNVIKIDVEGFEEEVLRGLSQTLRHPECRAIFCEVHFTILSQRGERHAPVRIQKLLRNSGFKIKWIDASHMAAYKR